MDHMICLISSGGFWFTECTLSVTLRRLSINQTGDDVLAVNVSDLTLI